MGVEEGDRNEETDGGEGDVVAPRTRYRRKGRRRARPAPNVPGIVEIETPGSTVLVADTFESWDRRLQQGYVAQRRVFAAEAEIMAFAYDCLQRAEKASRSTCGMTLAQAELNSTFGYSSLYAESVVMASVVLVEGLPKTFEMFVAGWIGMQSAITIANEVRHVDGEHLPALDADIADMLGPTRHRTHPPRGGHLTKRVSAFVKRRDPVAASVQAKKARSTCDVYHEPTDDDLSYLGARVPAEIGVEIMERVERVAATADADDGRTKGQLRVEALLALCRGRQSVPDLEGSYPHEPNGLPEAMRVVVNTFVGEHKGQAGDAGGPVGGGGAGGGDGGEPGGGDSEPELPTDLVGYGPITAYTGGLLSARATRKVHRLGRLACPTRVGARNPKPSAVLRLFCQGRDGGCVFPGCQRPAEATDLDHIEEFDHGDPGAGGPTTSDNLACLCRRHHRYKTLRWWTYWRDPGGTYVWIHGPSHPDPDPGLEIRTESAGPLAHLAAPWDPATAESQKAAARRGSGESARHTPANQTSGRQRMALETRRVRRHAEECVRAARIDREEAHRRRMEDPEPAPF